MSRTRNFLADQRGAVAFEMLIVFGFLIIVLLLPLADMAIFGFKYISAWQALRAFGQSIQYSPPDDVTNPSETWTSAIATAEAALSYPISSFNVLCDSEPCTSANSITSIKSYSYSTTITLHLMSPMVQSVLCQGNSTCEYTLSYSERFQ